jgi:hypothetical protein
VIAVVAIRVLICLNPPFQNSSIISSIQGNAKFLVNRHLFGSDYHDTFWQLLILKAVGECLFFV